MPAGAQAPVGIFDSGLGGLSVLRHVRQILPRESLLYVADSAYAPYGGKPEAEVVARTLAIAGFLVAQGVKALVVACNTATAAAIAAVRAAHPQLIVIGVEPGLRPAALQSARRVVGVLATERTLASARFQALEAKIAGETGVRFEAQACPGLADQVEKGELRSLATLQLVRRYVAPLVAAGADTLVLGCTHYPFLAPVIHSIAAAAGAPDIGIIDTGDAVARQLRRRLEEQGMLSDGSDPHVAGYATGSMTALRSAFSNLLGLTVQVGELKKTRD